MKEKNINFLIKEKGLRVTPQRVVVLEALTKSNHPTVEMLTEIIHKDHPNIAIGTIYKVLETFVEKDLAKKVLTKKDIMRYDAVLEPHHHLYCTDTDRIEDYYDEELNEYLNEYFKKKNIKGFMTEKFSIQLTGRFKK